ncbi:hypothetical protein LXL04_015759 [Taraxacum kok-saghyz]
MSRCRVREVAQQQQRFAVKVKVQSDFSEGEDPISVKENLMADNHRENYGSNMTSGHTSRATVIPAEKKHVSTMIAEKTVKVIASAAKSIKNKNKINPGLKMRHSEDSCHHHQVYQQIYSSKKPSRDSRVPNMGSRY